MSQKDNYSDIKASNFLIILRKAVRNSGRDWSSHTNSIMRKVEALFGTLWTRNVIIVFLQRRGGYNVQFRQWKYTKFYTKHCAYMKTYIRAQTRTHFVSVCLSVCLSLSVHQTRCAHLLLILNFLYNWVNSNFRYNIALHILQEHFVCQTVSCLCLHQWLLL